MYYGIYTMVEIGTDYLLRLHTRVKAELKYIDERLVEAGLTPKTKIVLTIMKKRLEAIVKDAEEGKTTLMFKQWVDKEAEKIDG
jgi:hypothetical protein